MQRFDENVFVEISDSRKFGGPDFDPDLQEAADSPVEEAVEEPTVYTDDPVRVYLREMGSVSLLNRQAEVTLARRMERGILRMQKALSRSPLVRKLVLEMYEDLRTGKVDPAALMNVGGADEGAKRKARNKAM